MNPEAFDDFCRNKLEQLQQVPQLEWNEKRTWNKLKSKLSKNYRILSFTALAILLALFLLGIWKYGFKESHLIAENKKRVQQSKAQAKPSLSPPFQAVDSLKVVKADAKKGFPAAVYKPLQGKKQILPVPALTTIKTLPSVDTIKNTVSRPPDTLTAERLTGREDSLYSTTTNIPIKPYKNESAVELYSSVGSKSHSAGVNVVKPLSQRFTFLYGFHTTRIYNPYFNFETYSASKDAIGIQIPLQIRHYLLPQENRFILFLYAGLTGALPLSGLGTATYPAIRFESGAEVRYRLWANKDGRSKGYLFFRMPLYNRTILNYNNNANGQIKNNHGIYPGETSR